MLYNPAGCGSQALRTNTLSKQQELSKQASKHTHPHIKVHVYSEQRLDVALVAVSMRLQAGQQDAHSTLVAVGAVQRVGAVLGPAHLCMEGGSTQDKQSSGDVRVLLLLLLLLLRGVNVPVSQVGPSFTTLECGAAHLHPAHGAAASWLRTGRGHCDATTCIGTTRSVISSTIPFARQDDGCRTMH